MEYHEALALAKNNPGSVLTRDSTGSFIVRFSDGRIVGSSPVPMENNKVEILIAECERLSLMLNQLRSEHVDLRSKIEHLESDNKMLAALISRISKAELARIEKDDNELKAAIIAKDRAELEARDEIAKRMAREMAKPILSSNVQVVFSRTDGQD